MTSLFDIFPEDNFNDKKIEEVATKVAESANPATDLVADLIYWLENEKIEIDRAPGLHCSSLWETCARREILKAVHASHLVSETLKAGDRLTFDVGHALHDLIQNSYLGPFGRLWGNWKCLKCQEITFQGTLPVSCPKCNIPWRNQEDGIQNIVYAELFVEDKELNYCGHCDGILLGRLPIKRVFEFKTKSKSQFDSLRHPDMPHVIQVHAYMNALKLREAVILYLDKGSQCDWTRTTDGQFHSGSVHLKSYLIKFDENLWSHMEARIKNYHSAQNLMKTLPIVSNNEAMLFPRICSHIKCELALSCEVAKFCFQLPN